MYSFFFFHFEQIDPVTMNFHTIWQAYRLEMGTKFKNTRGKDLYEFWGMKLTDELNATLKKQKTDVLLNLASNEYFKSVKKKEINAEIINPVFKDEKNGQYKI